MHKPVVVAMSIVLCAAFLAACGGSDSSSSSSTATATVPTGKLGAQAPTKCTPPRINGSVFTSFSATNIACDAATAGILSVYRTNKHAGWTCNQRISGRHVSANCTNNADTSQSFSASWQVS